MLRVDDGRNVVGHGRRRAATARLSREEPASQVVPRRGLNLARIVRHLAEL